MFTNISKAGLGMYAVIVAQLFQFFTGRIIGTDVLTEAIYAILMGAGAILWILGQVMRKDLSWGIFRTQKGQ